MKYVPKLDDYVSWRNVEGWVYYIDDEHLPLRLVSDQKRMTSTNAQKTSLLNCCPKLPIR